MNKISILPVVFVLGMLGGAGIFSRLRLIDRAALGYVRESVEYRSGLALLYRQTTLMFNPHPTRLVMPLVTGNMYNGYRHAPKQKMPRVYTELPKSAEDFRREHIDKREPCIFRLGPDGFRDTLGWRTHLWTDDYLAKQAGNVTIRAEARRGDDKRPFGVDLSSGTGAHPIFITFSTYIDMIMRKEPTKDTPRMYLNLQSTEDPDSSSTMPDRIVASGVIPALTSDFHMPHFIAPFRLSQLNVWMGRATDHTPGRSQLHYDSPDNLYALVTGRKRVMLFAPDDTMLLYQGLRPASVCSEGSIGKKFMRLSAGSQMPPPSASLGENFSKITFSNGTRLMNETPRFLETRPLYFDLVAGDLLYLPGGWFHQIESRDRHIAINFWGNPQISPCLLLPNFLCAVSRDDPRCNDDHFLPPNKKHPSSVDDTSKSTP